MFTQDQLADNVTMKASLGLAAVRAGHLPRSSHGRSRCFAVRRPSQLSLVLMLVSIGALVGPAVPAEVVIRTYLGVPRLQIRNLTRHDLASITFTGLAPGETRFLEGRMAARSTVDDRLDQHIELACRTDGLERIISARNHEGRKYNATGDSYVRDPFGEPVLTLHVRYLFRAPHAAGLADYTCVLRGGNGSVDDRTGDLIALRSVRDSAGNEVTGTWLQSTNQNHQGAHWVDMFSNETSDFNCQPKDLYKRCQPRNCPSRDKNGECQYVFPDREPTWVRILEMKVQKRDLRADWRPGDTAVVYADFELTSCYRINPESIAADEWSCYREIEPGAQDRSIDAHVLFRLEVADIDSTGRADACIGFADASNAPGWTFWPRPAQGYNGGDYRRERISYRAHHKKLYTALARRTSSNPDCSRLLVRVYLKADYAFVSWGLGQPIKVDTSRLKEGFVQRTHANGSIWLAR